MNLTCIADRDDGGALVNTDVRIEQAATSKPQSLLLGGIQFRKVAYRYS